MNEYDFDSPHAIDFDNLVERLRDLKHGCVLFKLFIQVLEIDESQGDERRYRFIPSKSTNGRKLRLRSILPMYWF